MTQVVSDATRVVKLSPEVVRLATRAVKLTVWTVGFTTSAVRLLTTNMRHHDDGLATP